MCNHYSQEMFLCPTMQWLVRIPILSVPPHPQEIKRGTQTLRSAQHLQLQECQVAGTCQGKSILCGSGTGREVMEPSSLGLPPPPSTVWEREQIGSEVGLSAVTLGGWPRHNGAGQWGRWRVQPGAAPLPPVPHRSSTIPLPHQQHRRQLRGMLEVLQAHDSGWRGRSR